MSSDFVFLSEKELRGVWGVELKCQLEIAAQLKRIADILDERKTK